jgi:hypothetical protein
VAHWPSSAGPCGPFCTCCPVRHTAGLPLNSNVRPHVHASLTLIACLMAIPCSARPLEPASQTDLASLLAFQSVLSETTVGERTYKVIVAPYKLAECQGTIRSCPDYRFFVVVVPDGLYERASVYRLPDAKGWSFVEWQPAAGEKHSELNPVSFVVQTAVPGSNVTASERARFRAITYTVQVNAKTAEVRVSK